MMKDAIRHEFTEESISLDTENKYPVKKSRKDDRKDGPHILLNLCEEPANSLTSALQNCATSQEILKKLTDTY